MFPAFTGVKVRRGALSPQTDFLTRLKSAESFDPISGIASQQLSGKKNAPSAEQVQKPGHTANPGRAGEAAATA